jgi:hypothetical protein
MARVDISGVGVVDSLSTSASAIASELRPSAACLSASEEWFLLVSTSSLAGGQRFLAQSAPVVSLSPALNARAGRGRAAKRHE